MSKLTAEQWAHLNMMMRTSKHNPRTYKNYAGRGISVCERWLGPDGFANFLSDMGKKPEPYSKWTLERLDNDGNYEPGNCAWATWERQANNKRSNRAFVVRGQRFTATQAAREFGIAYSTILRRLNDGLDGEDVIAPRKSLSSKKDEERRRKRAEDAHKTREMRALYLRGWSTSDLSKRFGWGAAKIKRLCANPAWWAERPTAKDAALETLIRTARRGYGK